MSESVMVTGHRPKNLPTGYGYAGYGYDVEKGMWIKFRKTCREILEKSGAKEAISGMALGCDTAFALEVLKMRSEGTDIRLVCAVPFDNQDAKWVPSSRQLYRDILAQADEVVQTAPGTYSAAKMMQRNTYMINRCDAAIALWDGRPSGGTADAVKKLKAAGKPVTIIDPLKP